MMAMHYYTFKLRAAVSGFVYGGGGTAMAFYGSPSALFYGI
jgi:hypothetical protein